MLMKKTATTVDEQIQLLQSRGLTITNHDKAREILLDIGYYRLGFYLFHFEKSYPQLDNRSHKLIDGASFEDAVRLYYFDFDLRLLLMRYLNRVEIAFRTALIYQLSNKYKPNSEWFISHSVVTAAYASDFAKKVYTSDFKRNPIIRRHHHVYPGDKFAPAWKTLEFMTFGAVLKLYEQLNNSDDKILIAKQFGVRQIVTFESYMNTIREVRNVCAHGLLLFDMKLSKAIRKGPARNPNDTRSNILGALCVLKFVVGQVSEHRASDLSTEVKALYDALCNESPNLKPLIPDFSVL